VSQAEEQELEFEKALEELEKIVEKLESSQTDLETSIEMFKKGVELYKYCKKKLDEASLKVRDVLKEMEEVESDDDRTSQG